MSLIAAGLLALVLTGASSQSARYDQITVKLDSTVPGIELHTYTLISSNPEADRNEAAAILELKVAWPRAMQTKDEASFNRILSNDFTFRAHGQLLDRNAYIRDRMRRREQVASARYQDVVLQIFGSTAVLTYNVDLVTTAGDSRETWHGTWADVFVREAGRWKIGASYLINERVERARIAR